jgi:hypothetical protein
MKKSKITAKDAKEKGDLKRAPYTPSYLCLNSCNAYTRDISSHGVPNSNPSSKAASSK